MHNVLILKKNSVLLDQLHGSLPHCDFKIKAHTVSSVEEAFYLLKKIHFSLIFCQFEIFENIDVTVFSDTPFIITDDNSSISHSISAIKNGAFDYFHTPITEQLPQLLSELPPSSCNHSHEIIGECTAMQRVFEYIKKSAPSHCNVLILGETGTGKELVAQSIHNLTHHNTTKPLISVNCAAIPDTLIESELFGYIKGAFTGANEDRVGLIEAAHNGTLFLDEIGELPMEAQARLLRFIQEGEIRRIGSTSPKYVNVRLICATHRNLKNLCEDNLFREDLFYRINVMQINLPPLRERGSDITTLARAILKKSCKKFNHAQKKLSDESIAAIMQYNWPGNIRELQNIIDRAIILSEFHDTQLHRHLLDIESIESFKVNTTHLSPLPLLTPEEPLSASQSNSTDSQSLEDYFMSFVLTNQHKMSETELAKKLGISRKCLWERRQRLGIPRKK
jgi:two-component system, NtrC family, response regulator HydG